VALVAGFGALHAPSAKANPTAVYVVNDKVGAATVAAANSSSAAATKAGFDTAIVGPAAAPAAITDNTSFSSIETSSGNQIPRTAAAAAAAGSTYIVVVTDGSTSGVTLNGKGLVCAPLCDTATPQTPDATDHIAVWQVVSAPASSTSITATAT